MLFLAPLPLNAALIFPVGAKAGSFYLRAHECLLAVGRIAPRTAVWQCASQVADSSSPEVA
jgi:hypothetical protein